jgi:hypothetical protein
MLKFILGLTFFFSINLIIAQDKIELVKNEIFSENNYMAIKSWTNYHKYSKTVSEGKTDTTYMHFYNDTVIYNNNKDSSFCLSTRKYFYSIHDADSFVSFRIIDSTYIWGWNYLVIFDFIDKGINYVSYVGDTIYFNLNKNIEKITKVRYYKNDFIHLDFFKDTEYNNATFFVALKPTESFLPNTILDRIKRIDFINDSLVFLNTCSGYSIDCYNMKQIPTNHYFFINQ